MTLKSKNKDKPDYAKFIRRPTPPAQATDNTDAVPRQPHELPWAEVIVVHEPGDLAEAEGLVAYFDRVGGPIGEQRARTASLSQTVRAKSSRPDEAIVDEHAPPPWIDDYSAHLEPDPVPRPAPRPLDTSESILPATEQSPHAELFEAPPVPVFLFVFLLVLVALAMN
ncbi:MAG: hypothetical protein V2B18_07120 [Pseudomonadota bacterium]